MFGKEKAILLVLWLLILPAVQAVPHKEYRDIKTALLHGDPSLNFRLRQEYAKQESLAFARASTVQSKFGYQSADFHKNYLSLEIVNVSNFFGQHYNPAVIPFSKQNYTVITDPKGTGVANASITAQWVPCTDLILGRQYISLDNERMVGHNPFRQYPTSFDAVTIKNDFFQNFEIFYSFVGHINTYNNNIVNVYGRRKLNTNLANITWKNFIYGQITAYGYSNSDPDLSYNSQNTVGLRAISDKDFRQDFTFGYWVELALQKSKSNNPNKYSTMYIAASIDKDIAELFNSWVITSTLGYELLGGHNGGEPGRSFKFPLGSLYGFNGLAEGYTTTPDRGLIDYYYNVELWYLDSFSFTWGIHYFQFAKGSGQKLAGRELDFSMAFKCTQDLNVELRAAHLNSKNYSTLSVRRISGQLNYLAL
jgi:hypothetical protein